MQDMAAKGSIGIRSTEEYQSLSGNRGISKFIHGFFIVRLGSKGTVNKRMGMNNTKIMVYLFEAAAILSRLASCVGLFNTAKQD